MAVNEERVELFVAALESGKYEKCIGALRYPPVSTDAEDFEFMHCALGVAQEVALIHEPKFRNIPWDELWNRPDLHPKIVHWYGFSDTMICLKERFHDADWVGGWNDEGASFWDIAQAIRAQYLKDES